MTVMQEGASKNNKMIGEGRAYLFPEPHLCPGELIEATTEADLTQWFRVA